MRLGDMQFGQQKNLDPFKKNMDQKEEKDENDLEKDEEKDENKAEKEKDTYENDEKND